jgi:hypothetical protein
MDETTSPTPSRSGIPTWLKLVGGILGAVVILWAGAALLLRTLLDPEAVAQWAEPRVEAALNRPVSIEGVRLAFFPRFGADLTGVEVGNTPEFGEGLPLMEVEQVRLRVAFRPLLSRRVEVSDVRVVDPVLRLLVDAEGRTNFGELAPAADEPADPGAGPPMDLAVRAFRLSGGRLEYESIPDSMAVVVNDIGVRASLELLRDGNWSVASQTTAPEVLALHPMLGAAPRTFRGVGLDADVRAGPGFAWLEVDEGTLNLEEARFGLTGRIEDVMEPIRRVNLALDATGVDVPRFLSFLPAEMLEALPGSPEGMVDVAATLRGDLGVGVQPEFRGTVHLREVGLRTPAGQTVAEGILGRIELFNDSISVPDLAGRVLGGPMSLGASLRSDSLIPFRADLRAAPHLDRLRLVAELPQGTEVGGRAEVALRLAGLALDPGSLSVDGTVDLTDFRGVFPDLAVPVEIASGRLAFAGQNVAWEGLNVALGPDRITTGGSVRGYLAGITGPPGAMPHVDTRVVSVRLDLNRLFPPRGDEDVTYGQIAFAHLGGRTIHGKTASELAREKGFARPDSLPASGELRIRVDTLITAPWRLTDAVATVAFAPGLLQVTDAGAGVFGGRVRSTMVLGLGPEAEQPFTLSLGVESVQAGDFLAATSPVGRFIRGLLGLQMEASGTLDRLLLPGSATLAGAGEARVADGQLLEMPITSLLSRSLSRPEVASPRFREWAGLFRIEGSRLVLDETLLALGAEDGEFRFGGLIGLDGALDLAVRLAAPAARLDSLALARTGFLPAAVGPLAAREGLVRLGLRLGGTVTQPRLTPEASLAMGDLRQTLQAEGERRVQEVRDTVAARTEALRDTAQARIDAERQRAEARAEEEARELERRLQQEVQERGRGLLRRLRPDPTPPPADTVRPDTLRTDTLRTDTLRVDTLGADTLGADTLRTDTLRADTVPRDTIPRDTVPRDTIPRDTLQIGPGAR